jgi:putative transposase
VPFWKLHYHLVWATHGREPMIDEEAESIIRRSVWTTARSTKIHIHAIGMVADHIHVLASIPPSIAVSEAMRRFKGGSSHAVNDGRSITAEFRCQAEYGALSMSDRSLPTVIEYVNDQPNRHADGNLIATLERIEGE